MQDRTSVPDRRNPLATHGRSCGESSKSFPTLVRGKLWRATKSHTTILCTFPAVPRPCPNQLTFEFGQTTEDRQHQPAMSGSAHVSFRKRKPPPSFGYLIRQGRAQNERDSGLIHRETLLLPIPRAKRKPKRAGSRPSCRRLERSPWTSSLRECLFFGQLDRTNPCTAITRRSSRTGKVRRLNLLSRRTIELSSIRR
jgi:hypothetical protein